MANQNSIISYVPQPYFVTGADTLTGLSNVDSIENGSGAFDPDLSNYTTIHPTSNQINFAIRFSFNKQSDYLINSDMSLGLIGCSLLTYEDDGGGFPDLSTEFLENINCNLQTDIATIVSELISFAHNSQDSINTFGQQSMPSVISGGRANIVFSGLGVSAASGSGEVNALFTRVAADVTARPHTKLLIGHLFIGVDIPIVIDPQSFSWTLQVENERFHARDFGAISSDGTLVKRSTGEIIRIDNYDLLGTEVTSVSTAIVTASKLIPNFFDLIKINTSYPLLFNSYPILTALVNAGTTLETLNLTARQNFFSIYGFMDDPLELLTGEFRDGLNSEYRARYRIVETR